MFYKKLYALFLSLVLLLSLIPVQSNAKSAFQATAKPGCKEITLTWTPMEGAINYQPNLYLPDGSYYPITDFPSETFTFTHTGLEEGKEYCYTIVSYDKNAQVVAKTNKVCAKPKCEEPPPINPPENCDIVLKYTVGKTTYFVNDTSYEMETPPVIRESRMYLVISFVTKHIPGTMIYWDGAKQQITIKTAEGKTIKLWIGNPKAEVDGVMVDIDPTNPGKGAPFLESNRTKVAMRFVANHLNAKVDWFGATNTVVLTVQDIVNCGCTWIDGCIMRFTEAPNNQYQIFFNKGCDETKEGEKYLIDKKMKSKTDQLDLGEFLNLHPSPPPHRNSIKLCFDTQGRVRRWDPVEPIPEPPSDFTWKCGCVRDWAQRQEGVLIIFDENCTGNIPATRQVYINPTLRDIGQNLLPLEYLLSTNIDYCIELHVNTSGQVDQWKALPGKTQPNCCDEKKKGGIIVKMDPEDLEGTSFKLTNQTFGSVNNYGINDDGIKKETGTFSTGCKLDCNEIYIIEPINPKIKFDPPSFSVKIEKCCPDLTEIIVWFKYKARIIGTVSGNCNPAATINVYDSSNVLVWTGQTDSMGNYDTTCRFKCNETYKVVPSKPGCYFSPVHKFLAFTNSDCCTWLNQNKYLRADFKCECSGDKGRIHGKVSGECNPVMMTIEGINGTNYYGTFYTTTGGLYSTSPDADNLPPFSDCVLPCPNTQFRITPSKPGYSFTPPFLEIQMNKCCPDTSYLADFSCKKDDKPKAWIQFQWDPQICANWVQGSTMKVLDSTGNLLIPTITGITGTFIYDTTCIIPNCPTTYTVVVTSPSGTVTYNPTVAFSPGECCTPTNPTNKKIVYITCKKDDKPKGRIYGKVEGKCNPVSIKIEGMGSTTYSQTFTTNTAGNYEACPVSRCNMPCPGNYRVTPVPVAGYTITPAFIDIKMERCCDTNPPTSYVADFECKPNERKAWIKVTFDDSCRSSLEGAQIKIMLGNTVVWTYTGVASLYTYDTTCALPQCPATYTVTVTSPTCTFTVDPGTVTFSEKECCPEPNRFPKIVKVRCKPNERKAWIKVTFDDSCRSCIEGAQIKILQGNTVVWSYTGVAGLYTYDTTCALPQCPATYTVTVTSPTCTFTVDPGTVTFSEKECCPDPNRFPKIVKVRCKPKEETARIEGTVIGTCNPDAKVVIYDSAGNVAWTGTTNANGYFETSAPRKPCILKCPDTYKVVVTKDGCTVSPASQTVTFSERECCEDGQYKQADFKCDCKTTCCDWLFRTLPEARIGKVYICPGETSTISFYEVFNNCPKGSNAINFSISYPTDGKIVSITPNSFTLQPQTRQILSIQIKMVSPCKPEEVVNYPFTINTRECGKKEVNVVAYCKNCWCKGQSMIIRVTKLDLRGGILEGRPMDSKTPIQFFFNVNERNWASIKVEQCIEICYEDRKDAKGNPIKWALDYRVVECPQSVPPPEEESTHKPLPEKLLYLSNDPETLKLKSS